MEDTKILYVAQEIEPFVPGSEISTICRMLPQRIQEKHKEARLFMPKFGHINERRNQLHEVIRLSGVNIVIDDVDHPLIIKVASLPSAHMQVYFIDNDDLFMRKGIAGDKDTEFDDNDERMIFFTRGVLETVRKLRWVPDIIHCHGWFSSLVPFYVKKACNEDPFFKNAKIVTSVYGDVFHKSFDERFADRLKFDGLTEEDVAETRGKSFGYDDLIKFALKYSDAAIVGGANAKPELIEYAQNNTGKFLPLQSDETLIEAYDNFYGEVLK